MVDKRNCTEVTQGKVIKLRSIGVRRPTIVTVEYFVNGTKYEIEEGLKKKSEWIKIGFIPIGQKRINVMGDARVGTDVEVSYNPSNPAEAFITKNKGIAIA